MAKPDWTSFSAALAFAVAKPTEKKTAFPMSLPSTPTQTQEKDDIQSAFTCGVCLDLYKTPKNLPGCGHCYCQPCLEAILRSQKFVKNSLYCPECRCVTTLGAGGIVDLKTNVQLMNGAEMMKKQHFSTSFCVASPEVSRDLSLKANDDRCPHKGWPNTKLCTHCNTSFCERCITRHMELMKLEIAAMGKNLNERVSTALEGCDAKLSLVKESVEENVKKVDAEISAAREALEKAIIEAVKAKHSCLTTEAQTKGRQALGKFQRAITAIESKHGKDTELQFEISTLGNSSVLYCSLDKIAKLYNTVSQRNDEVQALECLKALDAKVLADKIAFQPDGTLLTCILSQFLANRFGSISVNQ